MVNKSEDSEVKLIDFGLAKVFGPEEKCTEAYGTLCYVAPEVLLHIPNDLAIDCWSLGIIIYVLLGRHLPFDSYNEK